MDSCKRVTMKKRPSPSYHAGDCKGLSKKGSDGRTYTSVADKRGIYTWKPSSKKVTGVVPRSKDILKQQYQKPVIINVKKV